MAFMHRHCLAILRADGIRTRYLVIEWTTCLNESLDAVMMIRYKILILSATLFSCRRDKIIINKCCLKSSQLNNIWKWRLLCLNTRDSLLWYLKPSNMFILAVLKPFVSFFSQYPIRVGCFAVWIDNNKMATSSKVFYFFLLYPYPNAKHRRVTGYGCRNNHRFHSIHCNYS